MTRMSTKASIQEEVLPELVEIMFTSLGSVITVGVALILASATVSVLHGDPAVAAFGIAGAVVLASRVAISLGFRRASGACLDVEQARLWERLYAVGGCSFAGLLGLFSAYVFFNGSPVAQLLVATVLLAYPTGMIVRVSVRPLIARSQLFLTLLPPAVAGLAIGGVEHKMMAAFFVAYLVSGLAMISHLHSTILGRVLAHREIAHRAMHDELTGLPNRAHFGDRLTEACDRFKRYGHSFAVLYLDLDRFKAVNDTKGHAAGDELLRQVAARLRATARSSDVIARLSGDEFALIQTPVAGPGDTEALAARIVETLGASFVIASETVSIGASIGAAIGHADLTPDALLATADSALYEAKEAGRGRYKIADLAISP